MKRIAWQCVNKEEFTMKLMKKIMAAVAASAVAVLSFASLTASADLKRRILLPKQRKQQLPATAAIL